MVEKSVFKNKKEIIEYVKNTYQLKVTMVKKLNRGTANIYILDNDKYILKEFPSKYSKEDIDKEVHIINHLSNYSIGVPKYRKTIDGKYQSSYKGKIIIIQEFIKGYTIECNMCNYNQLIECARYYGKIVQTLEKLPIKLPYLDITNWYSIETFHKAIINHRELLKSLDSNNPIDKKIKDDIKEKIEMIEKVKKYNFKDMNKVTFMNTHGDYNVLQLIYKQDKIYAVIDFVSACKMPIIWEIIRSYSYIDKDAKDGKFNLDNFTDYVKEVNKYIKLNEYDIKYIPYIYFIQILSSTYGYIQFIENRENIKLLEFAYFRTNICRYLYKNADRIVESLYNKLLDKNFI